MNNPKIIAVDFDGTLAVKAYPDIGEPIQQTIDALLAEQRDGAKIILWTCREHEPLQAAVKWCAEHGIHFDAVNSNLPSRIKEYSNDSRKIGADEYWDDKAVVMPKKVSYRKLFTRVLDGIFTHRHKRLTSDNI